MTLDIPILGERQFISVGGSRDQLVAQIAAAQHAVVERRQLIMAGLRPSAIDRMLRRRLVIARHPGVYIVGASFDAPLTELTAALLAVGHPALLDALSGAWLWGMLGAAAPLTHPLQIITPGERRRRRLRGVEVAWSTLPQQRDVRRRRGLPVLSPAWTLLRLAACLPEREVERALDEARVQGLLRPGELEAVLNRPGRPRGGALLRSLLEREREPALTRREAEERFLALVRTAALPPPAVNVRLHGYEVDFLWAAERVIVEVDGWQFHSSRSAFERDRRKTAVLSAHGYVVIRFTWRQITEDEVALIASLAQALALAAARRPA